MNIHDIEERLGLDGSENDPWTEEEKRSDEVTDEMIDKEFDYLMERLDLDE